MKEGKSKLPLGEVRARKHTPRAAATQQHKDKKREAKKHGTFCSRRKHSHCYGEGE